MALEGVADIRERGREAKAKVIGLWPQKGAKKKAQKQRVANGHLSPDALAFAQTMAPCWPL
jgi:hypothetical protein